MSANKILVPLHLTSRCKILLNHTTLRSLNCAAVSKKDNRPKLNPNVHRQASRKFSTSSPRNTTTTLRPYVDPKYSYAFGRSGDSLTYSTIDCELTKKAQLHPEELAYVSFNERREATFEQLDRDVDKVSRALVKDLHVNSGDFVGIFAYNCYNWIVIQFACSRIGAVLTPINPSYKSHELEFLLRKGKIKCLFMPGPKSIQSIELNNHLNVIQADNILKSSGNSELLLESIILMDDENNYSIRRASSLTGSENFNPAKDEINLKLNKCQMFNWSDLIDNDKFSRVKIFKTKREAIERGADLDDGNVCILTDRTLSPEDLFAVYYTSGTTGQPKGACVSQFTVLNNVRFCQARLRQGRSKNWQTVCVTTLPMFHIFAGVLNTLSPIVSPTSIVYSSHKYDIKAMVEAIIKYKANIITLTPTILIDMLTYIEVNKLNNSVESLKVIQSGGAALPPEVVTRTYKTLPSMEELRTGYGSTENGSVATLQTIHEPNDMRAFTVGPPLDFSEIRLVKPNTNDLVLLGERGEVQTRGFNTMIGYLDDEAKTSEAILESRWYRTGDIGVMHRHGSIQINGRLKQLIIKGGENIYPEEVEQIMFKLDYIEDVHVVGVPDKRFGEQVCAWIKLKPNYREVASREAKKTAQDIHRDDVLDFCKNNITYFKVPKYILFVDQFPMTPTKKVQNHLMTEKSIEIFNLQDQI